MRDPIARFGTFVGIDSAMATNYTDAAYWARRTEAAFWPEREPWLGFNDVRQVGDNPTSALNKLRAGAALPEMQQIWAHARFCFLVGLMVDLCNPAIPGSFQPPVVGAGTIGTGDDAAVWGSDGGATKLLNLRYKVSVMANEAPGVFPITAWLCLNEPDGNAQRFSAYAPGHAGAAIASFSKQAYLDRDTCLSRLVAIQRAVYNELRTDDRVFTKRRHEAPVASPPLTGSNMRSNVQGDTATNFNVYQMYTYNNGEVLRYCDVIGQHFHEFAGCFNYGGTGAGINQVATTERSPWHLWTAVQQGLTLANVASKPVYFNEYGVDEGELKSPLRTYGPSGPWNYDDQGDATHKNDHLPARRLLKVRRTGMQVCSLFYWGISCSFLFNFCNVAADPGMNYCPKDDSRDVDPVAGQPPYTPNQPAWDAVKDIFDPWKYVLSERGPWPLTITAKRWTGLTSQVTSIADLNARKDDANVGFHVSYSWAVLGDVHKPETADGTLSDTSTWPEWGRATITDNQIAFTAPTAGQGNQHNRAIRPVILPGHGRYKVTCTVTGNTGTARLIARGYDACNGLATTAGQAGSETTAASATLTATFMTVPHNVNHFPNLPKCAVVLECTAAANYSDVTIASA